MDQVDEFDGGDLPATTLEVVLDGLRVLAEGSAVDDAESPIGNVGVADYCDHEGPKDYLGVLVAVRIANDVLGNDSVDGVGHHHRRRQVVELSRRLKGVVP